MDEKVYQDFVKCFKVAVTNCSIYFPKHPIFSQSIQKLKEKINLFIKDNHFLTINVKPQSLIINEKKLEDKVAYKDLAKLFHRRKIKSLIVNKNVTSQELIDFLITVSSSEKSIISRGGAGEILKNKKVKNITVKELDYSQLLKGEGEAVENVWDYFFDLEKNQNDKELNANKIINNLEKIGNQQGVGGLLGANQPSRQLLNLFAKLKEKDKDKFKKGLNSLIQLILKDEDLENIKNKDEFKNIFSSIDPKDLANILFQILKSNQSLNPSTFKLFSTLIPLDIHKNTADKLSKKIEESKEKFDVGKISNLFSAIEGQGVVPIYQKNLSRKLSISKDQQKFYLDQEHLNQNYRLILIDLFFYELKFKRLEMILEKIISEINDDYRENIDFICKFAKIYKEKSAETDLNKFNTKIQKILSQAEKNIFISDGWEKFNFLTELLENSSLEASYYLDKIQEDRVNPLVLKLFFKFFPEHWQHLSRLIKAKIKNPTFVKKIIISLSRTDDIFALNILEDLFDFVSIPAKIEILEIMKKYPRYNKEFFLSIAKSQNFNIRKKAVEVSVKFPDLYLEIVKNLLLRKNYFGIGAKTILENLDIIKENFIPKAIPFLQELKRRKYFWNRKIRNKAKNILETYYGRKN